MSMNGTDILILVNVGTPTVPIYQAAGSQRDGSVEETTAVVDVSSKDRRNQRVLPGRYASTISLDSLYIPDDGTYHALQDAMRNGDMILVAKEVQGTVFETANAVITSMSESYPDQDAATISFAFTIDDGWTVVGS
jgi:TP901-1 family phage major tail protein